MSWRTILPSLLLLIAPADLASPELAVHPAEMSEAESGPWGGQHRASDHAEPRKLALLIAIASYDPASGYRDLHSDNDLRHLRPALARQGFDSTAIRMVRDEHATRESILAAIDEHLVQEAAPGDIIFLHYSGHGSRLTDDDGDELDGYDEVLVPYDAPARPPASYAGDRHVRDDELNDVLRALRRRVGPEGNVIVSIDACYSGSATRAALQGGLRTTPEPIGPPAESEKRGAGGRDSGSGLVEEASSTRGGSTEDVSSGDLAPYVVMSAARHDEQSLEVRDETGERVGALSLALSQALAKVSPGTTYREFFGEIREQVVAMSPAQTPQLEGDADTEVLNGRAIPQTPYVRVREVRGPSEVLLDGGSLLGLLPGTRVTLHPAGTHRPDEVTELAAGEVDASNPDVSRVVLDVPSDDELDATWAFVSEFSFGDLAVRVMIDSSVSGLPRRLADAMRAVEIVELVDSEPDLILTRVSDRRDGYLLQEPLDDAPVLVLTDALAPDAPEKLTDALRTYARRLYLLALALEHPEYDVQLEIVPAAGRRDELSGGLLSCDPVEPDRYRSSGDEWTFSPGDWFMLQLHNSGERDAYVTVLDLMPDGAVGQLFPDPRLLGADNVVQAGTSHLVEEACFEVVEPFGREVLKLFATRDRVDFWPLLTGQRRARGEPNPLELLLADAYQGTRAKRRIPSGVGSTHAVMIRVVPGSP